MPLPLKVLKTDYLTKTKGYISLGQNWTLRVKVTRCSNNLICKFP